MGCFEVFFALGGGGVDLWMSMLCLVFAYVRALVDCFGVFRTFVYVSFLIVSALLYYFVGYFNLCDFERMYRYWFKRVGFQHQQGPERHSAVCH